MREGVEGRGEKRKEEENVEESFCSYCRCVQSQPGLDEGE